MSINVAIKSLAFVELPFVDTYREAVESNPLQNILVYAVTFI
jgi:hypothetical protein